TTFPAASASTAPTGTSPAAPPSAAMSRARTIIGFSPFVIALLPPPPRAAMCKEHGRGRPTTHRQSARPRRAVLAPRRRALDRRGAGRARRHGADQPGRDRDRGERYPRRRQAASRTGTAPFVALPQTGRAGDHASRRKGSADRV